jgi:hypothetical protein
MKLPQGSSSSGSLGLVRFVHIVQEDAHATLLVFDTLLFGLTLFKTLSLRETGLSTPLISLLMRDGIIYFLCAYDIRIPVSMPY